MGTLFPNDAEYPDHKPIPSVATKVGETAGITALAAIAGLSPLCPALEHKAMAVVHGAHHPEIIFETRQALSQSAFGGSSSSTGDLMSWYNRSVLDAADAARQRHYADDIRARIAGMNFSSTGLDRL